MDIKKSVIKLNEVEYFKETFKKTMIVLHHTVSSGKAGPVIEWWNRTAERVATAFIIEKDGSIIQVFDEKYWSYHIGKGATKKHNQVSIGIEIVNEGPVFYNKVKNKNYWNDGRTEYVGLAFMTQMWRGVSGTWASYTPNQIDATAELCKHLCDKYDIPKVVVSDFLYKPEYLDMKGIVSHHNLRADKTDVSIAWPMQEFINKLA